MDAKRFVERVVDALVDENKRRVGTDKNLLDVAFMVAPIEQHIEAYSDLLAEIDEEFYTSFAQDPEDYYSNGELIISSNHHTSAYYRLSFTLNERMWGYCECEPHHEGYNQKRRCCGNGCDWTAPAFVVEKIERVAAGDWSGSESDYWRYEETMNARLAEKSEDVAREERARRERYLREEIERLQKRLAEL